MLDKSRRFLSQSSGLVALPCNLPIIDNNSKLKLRNCGSAPGLIQSIKHYKRKSYDHIECDLFVEGNSIIDQFVIDDDTEVVEGATTTSTGLLVNTVTRNTREMLDLVTNTKHALSLDVIELSASLKASNTLGSVLTCVAMELWKKFRYFSSIVLEDDVHPRDWEAFFNAVSLRYYDNPYHNVEHAADVLLTVSTLVDLLKQDDGLRSVQVLAVFVAAAIHDIRHIGLTNAYLRQSKHPLTLEYPDTASPMEAMHSRVGMAILKGPTHCKILDSMALETKKEFLHLVPHLITYTDLAQQQKLFASVETGSKQKSRSDNVVALLLHAADLGSGTKSELIHRKWVSRINEELFSQGDLQRASNFEISIGCDREASMPLTQVGFLNHVVRPVYIKLDSIGVDVYHLVANIDTNVSMWQSYIKKK